MISQDFCSKIVFHDCEIDHVILLSKGCHCASFGGVLFSPLFVCCSR